MLANAMVDPDHDPDTVVAAFDAALDGLTLMLPDTGTSALRVLRELERLQRRITATGYRLIRTVAEAPGAEFGGQRSRDVLAAALRIHPRDAAARLFESAQLTPGLTMTGQPVEPELPALAEKVESGIIGRDHVKVVRTFLRGLPAAVDAETRAHAERELAGAACSLRPDQLRKLAIHLDAVLNPDGNLSDERDRACKRGIRIGDQERDGMSKISGYLSPELRAGLEAIFAKLAQPGMCDPDDDAPTVDSPAADTPVIDTGDGDPSPEWVGRDSRTASQRRHDALHAVVRAMLASGDLGQHAGLPVTIVITTTIGDLLGAAGQPAPHPAPASAAPASTKPGRWGRTSYPGHDPASPGGRCGKAYTATGTFIPYRDLIRMATHAWHYLAVFDDHTDQPLYLGRSKRLASPDQRIVATAQYGGCSFPGCERPATDCEMHHLTAWLDLGNTDITDLAPACGHHHALVDQGWQVHRDPDTGRIDWTPPEWLDPDRTPRTNTYHRPARWFRHRGGPFGSDAA